MKIVSGLGQSGRIPEGSDVIFKCYADANPMDMTYRWYLDKELVREDSTELLLRNVTRSMHDAMVKCKVKNVVGESEAVESLDVNCEFIFWKLLKV